MIVQRRFFISAPALLGASLILNRTASGAAETSDFEEITKRAGEYAKRMIEDPVQRHVIP